MSVGVDRVIRGIDAWNRGLWAGMSDLRVGARHVQSFPDMPACPYYSLANSAGASPSSIALVDDWGHRISYRELLLRADGFASWLYSERGVRAGSHVAVLMFADVEFAVALYALSKLRAVCVPLPTKYRKPEIVSLMDSADITHVICDERFEPWAKDFPISAEGLVVSRGPGDGDGFAGMSGDASLPDDPALEDPAILMFTSGTTSCSKGVMLRNYNLMHAATVYARLMRTVPTDSCLIPIPIYHVTGLIALLLQFVLVGATTYLQRFFDARRVLECVRDEGITYLHGSPTSFAELLPLRPEFPCLPSVRAMLSGSSYEPVEKMRTFHAWMPTASFQVVYGLTETASPALLFPYDSPTSVFAGATGKPVPGIEARVVDEGGREVAPGEAGELQLRGTCVSEGYYRRQDPAFGVDGWFATGDVAYANDEGMVWVVDRKKDMINRGGEKVWCSALEEVLSEVDGVSQSCAAALPDELYGEVPVAAVVRERGSTVGENDIKEALAGRIAHFKIPVHIVFVDKIPQTRGEKPDRRAVSDAVRAQISGRSNAGHCS